MNLEALQRLAEQAPEPSADIGWRQRQRQAKLAKIAEERKAREDLRHQQWLAQRETKLEFERDVARGCGMPPTGLALWLMANFTPMRLSNGRLVWLQLFYPVNYYPQTEEYAELDQLREDERVRHLDRITPFD